MRFSCGERPPTPSVPADAWGYFCEPQQGRTQLTGILPCAISLCSERVRAGFCCPDPLTNRTRGINGTCRSERRHKRWYMDLTGGQLAREIDGHDRGRQIEANARIGRHPRRSILRRAGAIGLGLSFAGLLDRAPAPAGATHDTPNALADQSLRQLAASRGFSIGGLGDAIVSSFGEDFTHILIDGPIHMNRFTQPGPAGFAFTGFDLEMDQASRLDLYAEVHHLVWGYQGSDGTRIAEWVPAAVAEHGGDPLPVLEGHIDTVIQHIRDNYEGRVSTVTVVNEPLSWEGHYADVATQGGYYWTNFWNNASALFYGDARYYIAQSFQMADRAVRRGAEDADRPIKLTTNEWGQNWAEPSRGMATSTLPTT